MNGYPYKGMEGFREHGELGFSPAALVGWRRWNIIAGGVAAETPALGGLQPVMSSVIGSLRSTWSPSWQWSNFVNTAECLRAKPGPTNGGTPERMLAEVELAKVHQVEKLPVECGCGFWAYTEGGEEENITGHVTGVVQAWGRVNIGPRGFRAQYARIVAMAWANRDPKPHEVIYDRGVATGLTYELGSHFLRIRYPSATWFDSIGEMRLAFPASDTADLLNRGFS